jgi:superfamily I DNA and/or RNA helicase/very-short-patch-repair endonuclease
MAARTRYCPNCNLITQTSENTCRHCGYNFITNTIPTDSPLNEESKDSECIDFGFNKEIDKKIDYWKSKLIDLSRRNNLVSYRFTKSKSIKLEYPDLENTIRDIQNKNNIRFHKKGDEEEELENTALNWVSFEDDATTNRKLYNLYLKARENFQELGINTLFIGLGILHYKNDEGSKDFNQASIIMCPIEIDRLKSIPTKYHRFEIDPDFAELHVNPALKEKLSFEWGISLKELEEESRPIDYFAYLEEKISSLKEWHIENSIVMDIFSYQKFIMYQDLKANQSNIKSNPLIRAYVGDRDALGELHQDQLRGDFNDSTGVDVLKADSSQKKAIELAKAGVTFVLQGPPGTGKSQTIVNIISALMEENKKILFVSQKKAALDVVLKRLAEIGLDRYTLNLHTYRGNKKEIVNQLVNELENFPTIPTKFLRYSPNNYLATQNEVNEYYRYLCEPEEIRSLSIYDARGKIARKLDVPIIDFPLVSSLRLDDESYQKVLYNLEQIDIIFSIVPDPLNNVYFHFDTNKNTILAKETYENLLDSVIEFLFEVVSYCGEIRQEIGLDLVTLDEIRKFITIHEALTKISLPKILISNEFYEIWETLTRIKKYFTKKQELYVRLGEKINEGFITDNTDNLQYNLLNTSFLNKIFKGEYRAAKKTLDGYSKTKLKDSEWIQIFALKAEYQKTSGLYETLLENNFKLSKELGQINEAILEKYNEYCVKIDEILTKYDSKDNISIIQYMVDSDSKLAYYKANETDLKKINDYFVNYELVNILDPIVDVQDEIEKALKDYNEIDQILHFSILYTQLSDEIQKFIQSYLEKDILESVAQVFEKTYHVHVLDTYEKKGKKIPPKNQIPVLREKDFEVRNAKRYQVMNAVQENKPQFLVNGSGGSEVSTLRRESKKKRRLKPIRNLLQEIDNLVFKLTPCFMMSPLTVSQYIDFNGIHFDVVIFDEASQIMPEDAVSCLLRSDQAIIMGDSQQLPPTSFFNKGFEEDEIDEDIIDLDSFLTESSLKFREELLNWHYRSKNENLIAFSNYSFYENRLITFPNQNELDNSGIEYVLVENGVYDRGKSRTNRTEAKKIVEIYRKLLRDEKGKSIGIIAFSQAQERAIRDQFEIEGLDIEGEIDETEKSLFIKNLETVQGDERDIILISVGYGPDSNGVLTTNFGPINKEGGYKRLNVAITRSRYKTIVITSIDPSRLEDDKLNTEGPRYLKNYLMYAKTKKLPTITGITTIEFDSDFEEAVYDTLEKEGIEIVPQVGCSGYRIDLAVKHPEKPGEYILGIECDGAKYHSSRFARDRDKVRQEVLESLGWSIHRIWSDDWLADRGREVELIKAKINNLLLSVPVWEAPEEEFEEVENHEGIPEFDPREIFPEYEVALVQKSRISLEFDQYGRLKRPNERTKINNIMKEVLEVESPMTVDLLYKRVNTIIGVGRMGTRIKKLYDDILSKKIHGNSAYKHGDTVSYNPIPCLAPIRISKEEDREFLSIPIEELAHAFIILIENLGATSEEHLSKNVSRIFYDNNRSGKNIMSKMKKVIRYLDSNGYIGRDSDGHIIKK